MPRTARLPRLLPLSIIFGAPERIEGGTPQEIADKLHARVAALGAVDLREA